MGEYRIICRRLLCECRGFAESPKQPPRQGSLRRGAPILNTQLLGSEQFNTVLLTNGWNKLGSDWGKCFPKVGLKNTWRDSREYQNKQELMRGTHQLGGAQCSDIRHRWALSCIVPHEASMTPVLKKYF